MRGRKTGATARYQLTSEQPASRGTGKSAEFTHLTLRSTRTSRQHIGLQLSRQLVERAQLGLQPKAHLSHLALVRAEVLVEHGNLLAKLGAGAGRQLAQCALP